MAKRSITVRSLLWTWGFFLLVLSGVFVFATQQMERSVLAEAEERAKHALGLVEYLLSLGDITPEGSSKAEAVDILGRHMGLRLTYIMDGRVVADSEVGAAGVPAMENHADRPEVRQALATGYGQAVRFSQTLGRDMLYVAKPFAGSPGIAGGVVRLALPFSDLGGELGRLRHILLAVLALVFVAGGVAAYGLARSTSRSLGEISEVVTAIGQGGFDRRIHIVPARDFMPLAEAINALAERVGAHVQEIEERRKRQAAILDGMAEGVAIFDARGRMLAVNRALGAMFPQTGELTGKTPIEAGMSLDMDRYLAGGWTRPSGPAPNGRFELPGDRVVEVTVVPVVGTGGTQVATFHDITESAAMDRIFQNFVIDASHRLRTPLTKVRGFAETARDICSMKPDEAGQALAVVIRAADEIKAVIDDLLAAARERFALAEAARHAAPGGGSGGGPDEEEPARPDPQTPAA
jgi:two-component system phosphate regulon sensor histidine kinase PhoR